VPSEPLNPVLVSIEPDVELIIGWNVPVSDGCLPILSYTLSRDNGDHIMNIAPSLKQITDDLSVSGSTGDVISYKLKAKNQAGFSTYSQTLVVKVGSVPNAPVSLTTVKFNIANEVQVTWNEGSAIAGNPPTLAYRVYLDDGSGNEPVLAYDTGKRALTNLVTIKGLTTGQTYILTVRSVNVIGESSASNSLTV
jgi:hypothetical protein